MVQISINPNEMSFFIQNKDDKLEITPMLIKSDEQSKNFAERRDQRKNSANEELLLNPESYASVHLKSPSHYGVIVNESQQVDISELSQAKADKPINKIDGVRKNLIHLDNPINKNVRPKLVQTNYSYANKENLINIQVLLFCFKKNRRLQSSHIQRKSQSHRPKKIYLVKMFI